MSDGRCACGRELSRLTVATKTQKFGKHLVVKKQEAALVCPDCGVIAFQPRPVTSMWGTAAVVPGTSPWGQTYA